MTAAPSPRLMTADELLAMPDDGGIYELVRGELISMSPSAYLPAVVAGRTLATLGGFVLSRRLGEVGTAEGGFYLFRDPDTVRAPDVWFVRASRVLTGEATRHFFGGAPDLAIEILSPSDRYVDVMAKVCEYIAAGSELVWVIDPFGRTAAVFGANRRAELLDEDGMLNGGDVIPGFSVALRDLFPAA